MRIHNKQIAYLATKNLFPGQWLSALACLALVLIGR
jgi:hypothetical protein